MKKWSAIVIVLVLTAMIYLAYILGQNPLQHIVSIKAPKAIGPYSQAVSDGSLVFVSGQIAINPITGIIDTISFQSEVTQVLSNLKNIVESSNSSFDRTLKVTVYLTDLSKFEEFNQIYSKYFSTNKPARETVEVKRLPKNAHVEISLIAKTN